MQTWPEKRGVTDVTKVMWWYNIIVCRGQNGSVRILTRARAIPPCINRARTSL